MIWNDSKIRSEIRNVFPDHADSLIDAGRIQPASVDLTIMDPLMEVYASGASRPGRTKLREAEIINGCWILVPRTLYLVSTTERIVIPHDTVGRVDGRSSWGRIGLRIHATAGFIDPGFQGNITLELDVAGSAIELRPGDSICQVSFHALNEAAADPYGKKSKYQDQSGVTSSRDMETGKSR